MLNKRGVTLVEVMMALLVLLFVSLALMQTALVSIESNMKNVLRDEAVSIAEGRVNEARNIPYTIGLTGGLSSDGTDARLSSTACPSAFWSAFANNGVLVQRSLRNWSTVNFCTNRQVRKVGGKAELAQVTITVGWRWKGDDYSHTQATVVTGQ